MSGRVPRTDMTASTDTVSTDTTTPTVLLIGDSIRVGYQDQVAALLDGHATVRSDNVAAGNTDYFLEHLDEWLERHRPHVVHANAGLHDIRRSLASGELLVPPERYRSNLTNLAQQVAAAGARLILATTTPVDEEKHTKCHLEIGDFLRRADEVASYNDMLRVVAANAGAPVDDLHAVAVDGGGAIQTEDGCHFTDEGCRLLADAVAAAVRAVLA